jgi:ubiquinone/menaquinone biosynthesis C-methylase UbiE
MSNNTTQMMRVARSKEATKAGYDRLSRLYDVLAGSYSKKFRDIGLEKLDIRNGETALEIGYGSGHCIKTLADSVGSNDKVYGPDISEGMHQVTQGRIEEAELSSRVQLYVGDAVMLPFEDEFFNAIFTSFTLEMFEAREIPVILGQCMRVLKEGGRLGVVSLSKQEENDN